MNLDGTPIVAISGDSEFSVTSQPSSTTVSSSGGTETFQVTFAPLADGTYNAVVSIDNDDTDENPYTFSITGGSQSDSPGNISGLSFWLKADADVEELASDPAENSDPVLNWLDQSGNGLNVTQGTLTSRPTFNTNDVNSNPALSFDGGDFLDAGDVLDLDPGVDSWSFFSVFNVATNNTGNLMARAGATLNQRQYQYFIQANSLDHILGGTETDGVATATGGWNIGAVLANTTATATALNGGDDVTGTPGSAANENTNLIVGARTNGTDFFLTGDIAELIVFDSELSDANRQRVESYLGIKYGITLDNTDNAAVEEGDYVSSDGTVIWDGDIGGSNATYHNDVAGVGRDDDSELSQLVSKSVNSSAEVTIAHGTDIASPTAFTDNKGFLMWGHDGDAVTFTNRVMDRVWKVQETLKNDTYIVSIRDNISTDNVYLVTHETDATFPDDANRIFRRMFAGAGSTLERVINFKPSQFFTFVEVPDCPQVSGLSVDDERDNEVDISWTDVNAGGDYLVEYRALPGGTIQSVVVSATNSTTLSSLTGGTTYRWRVSSICTVIGEDFFSNPTDWTSTFFTTTSTGCALPSGLNVTNLTNTTATVNWTGGVSDDYTVEYKQVSPAGQPTLTANGTGMSANLSSLTPGTQYRYRVQRTCDPLGSPSTTAFTAWSFFTTTTTGCDLPSGLNVTNLMNTTATVNWTGGVSDDYTVEYKQVSPAGQPILTSNGTGMSANLSSLTPGTQYRYRVQRTCDPLGSPITTAFTDWSFFTTTTTGCDLPSGLNVTNLMNTTATVNWTGGVSDDYTVEYKQVSPAGQPTLTANGTGMSANLSSLTPGTQYRYRVQRTCDPLGSPITTAFTAWSFFTTTTTGCALPSGLNVTNLMNTTATVNWTGGVTDDYTVEYKQVSPAGQPTLTANGTGMSANLSSLTPGTQYRYRVQRTCDPLGSPITTAFTDWSFFTTTTTGCDLPSGLNATNVMNTTATVNWTGSMTDDYTVEYEQAPPVTQDPLSVSGTGTSANLSGLTAGTQYRYRVSRTCDPMGSPITTAFTDWSFFTTTGMGSSVNDDLKLEDISVVSKSEDKINTKDHSSSSNVDAVIDSGEVLNNEEATVLSQDNDDVRIKSSYEADIEEITDLNLERLKTLTTNIFPNPTSNSVTFMFNPNEKGVGKLLIYSLDGHKIIDYSFNDRLDKSIDLLKSGTGLYLARIVFNDYSIERKIIVR